MYPDRFLYTRYHREEHRRLYGGYVCTLVSLGMGLIHIFSGGHARFSSLLLRWRWPTSGLLCLQAGGCITGLTSSRRPDIVHYYAGWLDVCLCAPPSSHPPVIRIPRYEHGHQHGHHGLGRLGLCGSNHCRCVHRYGYDLHDSTDLVRLILCAQRYLCTQRPG